VLERLTHGENGPPSSCAVSGLRARSSHNPFAELRKAMGDPA
jgi:hypothetical protein